MNGFEAMGQARLEAAEGQRQLAALFARAAGAMLARILDRFFRHLPTNKSTPW